MKVKELKALALAGMLAASSAPALGSNPNYPTSRCTTCQCRYVPRAELEQREASRDNFQLGSK